MNESETPYPEKGSKERQDAWFKDFYRWFTGPESREDHRREFTDGEWACEQPKGNPKYNIGDVVRFHAGGFGVIKEVKGPSGGWPSSYATETPKGMGGHKNFKCAWHYEGDFAEWVARSPLHSLPSTNNDL